VVLAVADDRASTAQLEALFTEQREAEWAEVLGDCGKYEVELAGEVAKGKLTLADMRAHPIFRLALHEHRLARHRSQTRRETRSR